MFSLSPALRTVPVMSYIDVVGTVTVATVTTVAWVYKTPREKPVSLAIETRKRGL